ncbi:hypothetical protein J671_3414 [Acinetobacter sp. 1130196]|uniref:DUF5991 domain-containing protein n=1 Tax=Acinetobacter calcoaceticus/baumannii complex TaxID=909768 RepID=UPI000447C873|nr:MULTISPECIES: DUF5991 domain-containing protein [Acinetobacter calcoaceticus/baumannii complex]EKU6036832.1 hypothetical protein [Acinetobacter nosocomialis]EXE77478.1 hypothetical protein J582_1890 [Acinetobacter sp. 1566109]EXE77931.1 hypothetical protein J582_1594 [Acinetobacter sp. 1566109]EXR10033.1 hypothetical protein J671_3414 [Acinetobacter sp. 1130196]MBJ9959256.1 hypothetical protein [Acinetobacter nosocomialis]
MKKTCFLLLLTLSAKTFANTDKWNGTYHYYSSEELPGGNVATIESVLTLTPKKCEYSIAGFQVDKSYICKVKEKNNELYFFKVQSGEKLGKVVFKKGKYYLYSDEVLDNKDNLFFKDK